MVYMLAAALGMRIGEALGLEIDKHFADDFSTVLVRQKVRKCKTASPLAKNGPALLCRIDPPDRRLTEDGACS